MEWDGGGGGGGGEWMRGQGTAINFRASFVPNCERNASLRDLYGHMVAEREKEARTEVPAGRTDGSCTPVSAPL